MAPFLLLLLLLASSSPTSSSSPDSHIILPGIEIPTEFHSLNGCSKEATCGAGGGSSASVIRVAIKHRDMHPSLQTQQRERPSKPETVKHSLWRDSARATRIATKIYLASAAVAAAPKGAAPPPMAAAPFPSKPWASPPLPASVGGSVESGFMFGSGEYFMDVYIGTPPKHFSLIIDTGSDLIWTQCEPCENCYKQEGPIYAPNASSTYKPISCAAAECRLVVPADADPCRPERPHGCRYSYWYGDSSNTTGDLATETMALGGRGAAPYSVSDIVFGCGHVNEGLFRGAGGLLGLGKGALSLPSQMGARFGGKFSYCLVNRYSNATVSSALTFGGDAGIVLHPDVQYTQFVRHEWSETFYYVGIDKVFVGGEAVEVAAEAWRIGGDGSGGTIIDSGTTLTYLNSAAYDAIRRRFAANVSYPLIPSDDLDLCYNVSGHSSVEFPSISFVFHDGAVFAPPAENYMLDMGDGETPTFCLAILRTPSGSPSILGNFLQQNFHFLYDLKEHKLGFAPMSCTAQMEE